MNYEVHHCDNMQFQISLQFLLFTISRFIPFWFIPLTDVICLGAGNWARSAQFPALTRARGAERVRRSRTSGAGARAKGRGSSLPTDFQGNSGPCGGLKYIKMVNSKNYKDICNYSDFKYIIIIKGNICCKNRFFAKSWTAKINLKKTYYIFKVTVIQ